MSPSVKPTILYVGQPIQHAHSEFTRFKSSFTLLYYDCSSKDEFISALSPGGKYSQIDGIVRPSNSLNDLPPLDKGLIAHLPTSCKIIASCNHGYDGEDTRELARRGIWYCNGAGGANDSTADIALFLIIAVFRYTSFCEQQTRALKSADYFAVERQAVDVSYNPRNHILGVIGLGEIGYAAAARARALGMVVHYFGRSRKSPAIEASLGGAVYHAELGSLLKVADCVLLACPHTPATHHLLNREAFKIMKKGARVVNVGRGKCIDEEALVEALEDETLAGVGLDVFHEEYVSCTVRAVTHNYQQY
jgi:lactate dehydrogenase-like 2-hydroxyacid dehydrogenase